MSQVAGRNAAFLEEMGIGAHWSLRRAAMTQLEPAAEYAEPAMVAEAVAAVLPVATAPAAQPAPTVVSDDAFAAALAGAVNARQDGAQELASTVAAPQEFVRAPATPVAASQAFIAADADAPELMQSAPVQSATGIDDVPTPTPMPAPMPAPLRHAAASAPPSSPEPSDVSDSADDSTAWFDDAPTPARPAPVSDEAIAMMDWPALKTAIATCTRCDLCATRRGVVPGRGAADAQWIAIGAGPNRLDEKENRAITGDAGQLLDNMLKAIALTSERDVYITNLVKCRPSTADGADRAPTPDEVAACRPYLERELALTGAAMAITFGQHAAKGLLGAAARGKVLRYGELPVVASYHPDDLLRRPEDKAKAWGDLCLARAARDGAV